MTGSREIYPPPPSLFRTATSVSLAGTASYTLISTILASIQPSRLLHLCFNNLQTFADEQVELIALNAPNIDSHRRTRHGAAQGFLADFAHGHTLRHQCSSSTGLGTLTVRGIGHRPLHNAWREDAKVEETNWLHEKTADFREKAIRIWEAAPKGCQVVVEDEASRPFYQFEADKRVSGRGDGLL